MEMYHFVTKWYFRAPIERIWNELTDLRAWPEWWPSWKKISFHEPGSVVKLGSRADNEVKGFLPYTLRFTTEISVFQPPCLLELKSIRGLVGAGKMVLEERDEGTYVTYYWDVGTDQPVLNLFARFPLAKTMMEINHEAVMEKGYCGLRIRLGEFSCDLLPKAVHW